MAHNRVFFIFKEPLWKILQERACDIYRACLMGENAFDSSLSCIVNWKTAVWCYWDCRQSFYDLHWRWTLTLWACSKNCASCFSSPHCCMLLSCCTLAELQMVEFVLRLYKHVLFLGVCCRAESENPITTEPSFRACREKKTYRALKEVQIQAHLTRWLYIWVAGLSRKGYTYAVARSGSWN